LNRAGGRSVFDWRNVDGGVSQMLASGALMHLLHEGLDWKLTFLVEQSDEGIASGKWRRRNCIGTGFQSFGST